MRGWVGIASQVQPWLRPWVQVTHDVTLRNVTPLNNLLLNSYFEIQSLNYMFYMFLTCMAIFIPTGCNLPFDP